MQATGRLVPHRTSRKEIDDLRAVVARDLSDAIIKGLSDDRRFAPTYNAALQTAKILLACAGYRVTGRAHHQTSFAAIEIAIGGGSSRYSMFFDTCRRKRNTVDYDMSGIATRTDVNEIIRETKKFVDLVEVWIERNYPEFTR